MQRPRYPFLPALAILLMAGFLGACGVKGELDRPAATASVAPGSAGARMDEETRRAVNPETSAKSVFYERSVVRGASRDKEVIPQMPPKEWEKQREAQPERDARRVAPNAHERKPDPDKAFILDWLL